MPRWQANFLEEAGDNYVIELGPLFGVGARVLAGIHTVYVGPSCISGRITWTDEMSSPLDF
jgi:hypothetical protein